VDGEVIDSVGCLSIMLGKTNVNWTDVRILVSRC
jgi:hypothetical protein